MDALIESEDEAIAALHAVIPYSGQEPRSEALEHLMEHLIMRKQNQVDWLRARAPRALSLADAHDDLALVRAGGERRLARAVRSRARAAAVGAGAARRRASRPRPRAGRAATTQLLAAVARRRR